MAQIETKFNAEAVVFAVVKRTQRVRQPCPLCDDDGKVQIGDETRLCPDCYGRGYSTVTEPLAWRVVGPLTVGQIRVEITPFFDGDEDSMFGNLGHQEGSYRETYMMRETGIGSGTMWEGDTLYATRALAQAEYDRENKEDE